MNKTLHHNYLRISIIVFVWISTSFHSISQGFTRDYNFENRATIFRTVALQGDEQIIIGESGTDTSFYTSVFAVRLDTFGEVMDISLMQDPELMDDALIHPTSNCLYVGEEDILFSGSMLTSNNLFVAGVDKDLNLSYFNVFPSEFLFRATKDLITTEDAHYIIGGVQQPSRDMAIFVQKISRQGEFIWEKKYGFDDWWEMALTGFAVDDGIIIMNYKTWDPYPDQYNDLHKYNEIFKIDTSGIKLWSWSSELNEEATNPSSLLYRDGKYYYATRPAYQNNAFQIWFAAQIVCRDSLFNLEWRRTYTDTFHINAFHDLTFGEDGYLYAGGAVADEITWAHICKIDPDNGDLIWSLRDSALYVPGWGSRNVIESIITLPGGSIVGAGFTVGDFLYEHGLLIKVTPDGCIDTLCATTAIDDIISGMRDIVSVYPNPTDDVVNFMLLDHQPSLNLSIFSTTGHWIISKPLTDERSPISMIDLNATPGLYYWVITDDHGHVMDSGKIVFQ